jgi:23S rRNA pseudouridine2605 synthase
MVAFAGFGQENALVFIYATNAHLDAHPRAYIGLARICRYPYASMMNKRPFPHAPRTRTPRHGVARVLSKLGLCSRSEGEKLVRAGRVRVDGKLVHDPETPVDATRQKVSVDDAVTEAAEKVYVMFNKPRGVVVTASDERGRATVYDALADAGLPWVGPVGRLDKASEGLLLLSNDTQWAAGITEPAGRLEKSYHVQVAGLPDATALKAMCEGVVDEGVRLAAVSANVLRAGARNAWLEIVLDEGRNRQIRRLLAALGYDVLRLVRVRIGKLELGELPKGMWRALEPAEVSVLSLPRRGPG